MHLANEGKAELETMNAEASCKILKTAPAM